MKNAINYNLDNTKMIEKALCDFGLVDLINRPYLMRLKDVRLLGTMKYVVPLQHNYSRYEHSLAVAFLALSAAKILGLGNLASKIAVIAALLHDVGHTAMSHGAEVFLLRRQGRTHEGHTQRIIAKLVKELDLASQSDLSTLVQLAGDLLSGALPNSHNRRFYNSHHTLEDDEIGVLNSLLTAPMSVDTIEGVTRTARSIGLAFPEPSILVSSLSKANGELMVSSEAWPLVWDLFILEKTIYENYVYSEAGMAAEAMLTRALDLTFPKLSQVAGNEEIQEYNYKLVNDFLTWSDSPVIKQIQNNANANNILQMLENTDLFVSLAHISPGINTDILEYLGQSYDANTEERKTMIENRLASTLKLDPSHVILHSTIRKIFQFKEQETLRLFSNDDTYSKIKARSFTEIRQQFRTKRTSRTLQGIFLPKVFAGDLHSFSLPTHKPTRHPPLVPAISKRFSQQKEDKTGMVATPQQVVDMLVKWAVRSPNDIILDPACGDGSFLHETWNRLVALGASREALDQIIGVERQPGLWPDMKELWRGSVVRGDFFEIMPGQRFKLVDAVVGNPPYVRAHRFKGEEREKAILAGDKSLCLFLDPSVTLSRSSNYWAPFLLHACSFLSPSGRLAMVLPTELLTAEYAQPVRDFLQRRFRNISFVLFEKRIFEEEQDALLLLADSLGPEGIHKTEVMDLKDLPDAFTKMTIAPRLSSSVLIDKWTAIITNQDVLDLLDSLMARNLAVPFQTIATIKIGIVTGNSKYFALKPSEVRINRLDDKWLKPVLTKASQIQGAVFTADDLEELRRIDAKYLLLRVPPDTDIATDPDLKRYIDFGRIMGIHNLYKCSNRWPWYSVPYSSIPDMFLTYMSGKQCRLCINSAQVNSTNNLHQIFLTDKKQIHACAISFYSSLTRLSIELIGRGYGGGLIKLEPGDTKHLLLPDPKLIMKTSTKRLNNILAKIDNELRNQQNPDVWKELDDLVLEQTLGLSNNERNMLQEETLRLQNRRVSRSQSTEDN